MLNKVLGDNLLSIRKQTGLPQKEFAIKCNLKGTMYGKLERGEFVEKRDSYKVERIAKAFNINKEMLFKEKDDNVIPLQKKENILRFNKTRQIGNHKDSVKITVTIECDLKGKNADRFMFEPHNNIAELLEMLKYLKNG